MLIECSFFYLNCFIKFMNDFYYAIIQFIIYIKHFNWMIGGFKKIESFKDTSFQEAKDFNQKSFVIFDADISNIDEVGYIDRKNNLDKILTKMKVDYELFLIPNNKDNGCFENLLERIINKKYQRKLDCFNSFETCLKQYKDDKKDFIYVIPVIKSKMYSYISTFKKSKKDEEKFKNEKDWFYDNKEYWNFNSSELNNLKDFLLKMK